MGYVMMRFPGFKDKAVTLSYDDGVVYDKKLIEIMSKNGLKGTFNITPSWLTEESERHLSKDEALELYTSSGNEVAVHGAQHLSLSELDTAMAVNDVIKARNILEEMFGTLITGMAYANGSVDDKVVEVLKACGIDYSRTTISTEDFQIPTDWLRLPATCHHNNPRLMELARKFIEDISPYYWGRGPKLFYLWGHSYEFNDNNNWEIIEEFAEYIGNREDVWYATNMEIYKYVKAFDSLKFSAEGTRVYNPTDTDVYLNFYFDKKIIVPAGKMVEID